MGNEAYQKKAYHSISDTLKDGATNVNVGLGRLAVAVDIIISNDSQSSFTVKFNGVNDVISPAYTILAGEKLTLNEVDISSVYFTNRSGGDIAYRVIMWGEV